MRIVLSTDDQLPNEREAFWRHVMSDTFAPVTIREMAEGDVAGSIRGHWAGRLLVTDVQSAAINISTRYLHKLFEADHHTVSLYIKGLRLERARRDLLDPRLAGRPISTIAYSCGFGDLSGFKHAYALSPNELRSASASAAESVPSKPAVPGTAT